mmetsp:Transcript_8784/g.16118  ORF Transcript_8784/g.16118 Transcript_8784/m.16118 type:complete len:782 (+) Transcript_8784:357-2702(+)
MTESRVEGAQAVVPETTSILPVQDAAPQHAMDEDNKLEISTTAEAKVEISQASGETSLGSPKQKKNENEKENEKENTEEGNDEDDEEDDEDSEEESDEDDDPMAHLTDEQRKLIAERQAKLKKQFQDFAARELEGKVRDLVVATGVTEEEAKIAIECCNNDLMEAANRIATEPEFLSTLKEILDDTRWEAMERGEGADVGGSSEDEAFGRDKTKVEIRDADMEWADNQPARRPKRAHHRNGTCRKPKEGYRLDGKKRAENLKLHEALQRLEKIKRHKLAKEAAAQRESPTTVQQTIPSPPASTSDAGKTNAESRSGDQDAEGSSDSDFVTEQETTKVQNSNAKQVATLSPASSPSPSGDQQQQQQQQQQQADEVELTIDDLKALKWSDARIKAFLGRKTNPNAYYYRFNELNEIQETGEWSAANKKRFMELISEGVDYRWGIFSTKIPGRVGYQCSNFYRKLITEGVVHDPNYHIGEDGKLKFVRPKGLKRGGPTQPAISAESRTVATKTKPKSQEFKKRSRVPVSRVELMKKALMSDDDKLKAAQRARARAKANRRRQVDDNDTVYADEIESSDGDSDHGAYGYGASAKRNGKSSASLNAKRALASETQLIPGLKCPMTFEAVYDPAISPYGHVMSYDTWLRVLGQTPKNTCPFTKQKLTRRMLVKLTRDNLDQFEDQIKRVNTDVNLAKTTSLGKVKGNTHPATSTAAVGSPLQAGIKAVTPNAETAQAPQLESPKSTASLAAEHSSPAATAEIVDLSSGPKLQPVPETAASGGIVTMQ